VTTLDFAKAMIDEGYHPMTMYFPLVVHGAMLIEPPTETDRNIVRGTRMTPLVEGLEKRFARTRLVIFEDRFARARVPEQSPRVAVEVPPALHACVADPAKPWGCCVGRGCGGECCEKSLGSPSVRLTWVDPLSRDELRFEFRPGLGDSRLVRRNGARQTVYYCATDRRYGLD
jgi:hypothetical protein